MMQSSTRAVDFFQLPDLSQPRKQSRFSKLRSRLAAIGTKLGQALIADSLEPRVWQVRDRVGTWVWRSYDPITGQFHAFDSENEVRRWIEQRYNQ